MHSTAAYLPVDEVMKSQLSITVTELSNMHRQQPTHSSSSNADTILRRDARSGVYIELIQYRPDGGISQRTTHTLPRRALAVARS